MTEGLALTGLLELLDKYVFGGVPSELAADAIKGAYYKLTRRKWEDLYLDAFRQALHDSRDLLRKYAAGDGEIVLSDKQLKDALSCDLGVDVAKLSEATLTSAEFGRRLAAVLARRQALVIGGHNLSEADYAQIVARLVERAQSIFRASVQGNEEPFRQAVLAALRETLERDRKTQASTEEIERLVGQVDAFLHDRFDLVLTKLDDIQQDVKDTKEAVLRLSNPAVPTALNYLPPPPDDFVGRGRETRKLLVALRSGGATISGAAKAGVAGMPGVGKTALALYVAQQVAGEYQTHIYLDLKGTANPPPTPTEAMVSVVRAFDLSLDTSKLTSDDIKRLYFTRLRGRRVLLLLDNAADAWQVAPLLPGEGCAVLVTSRRTFVLPGLKPLPLGVLSLAKARVLLLSICPRIGAAATDLALLCGRLPQALRLAASHLAERQNLTVAEYLDALKERRTRLAALRSPGHPDLDVEAAFELSYDGLGAHDQERWRALGVFPAPFDAAAAAAVWGVDEAEARSLLSELARVSMVEYDEASKRYHLHDLLAAFAEARLSPEESNEAQRRHAWYFLSVMAEANDLYLEGGQNVMAGLRLFDAWWPHIHAAQAWAADNVDTDEEAADMAMLYPDMGVHCVALRLRPKDLVAWLQAALAGARRSGSWLMEGAALGNLGAGYGSLGEAAKAAEYHRQALVISREVGDRRGEAADLGNLANAHLNMGEAAKAAEYQQQVLSIAREIGDRRMEGTALGNLGHAYVTLGQTAKAVDRSLEALAIARETGDRHLEEIVLGTLGSAYVYLGQAPQAVQHLNEALSIARQIGDRRGEGNRLGGLGVAYRALGEAPKAVEHYQQALVAMRQYGETARTGTILRSLGDLLADSDAVRAEEAYREALALDLEDQRNYVGIVLILRREGREREAVPLLLKYAELAPDNPFPALALAAIYRQIGDDALSAEQAARVRGLLKPEDWYSLACLESVSGNTDAALDNLRRAVTAPGFDAGWAWVNWDLQWIREDPRFAEIVGPKPGTVEAQGEHETPEKETQG